MDGEATAREIRKIVGPETLIIIISAYDWSPIESKAKEIGINGFIAKPSLALPSTTGSPTQALKNIKDEIKKSSFKIIRRRDGFF